MRPRRSRARSCSPRDTDAKHRLATLPCPDSSSKLFSFANDIEEFSYVISAAHNQVQAIGNPPWHSGASDLDGLPPDHLIVAAELFAPEMPVGDIALSAAASSNLGGKAAIEQLLRMHVESQVVLDIAVVSERAMHAVSDLVNAAAAAVNSIADQLRATAGNTACKPAPVPQGSGTLDWKAPRPLNWVLPLESALWPLGCDDTQRERCRFFLADEWAFGLGGVESGAGRSVVEMSVGMVSRQRAVPEAKCQYCMKKLSMPPPTRH